MAKKPAPLTSQLLVRKGEATPSSINPEDRATFAAESNTHPAPSDAAPVELPDATAEEPQPDPQMTETVATVDPRPQTPEPEIILAADEETQERGSKRRLVGVLALVALSAIGVTAVSIMGGDEDNPSIAPTADVSDIHETVDVAEGGTPALAPSSPQSVGAPAAPEDIELRPGLVTNPLPPAGEPVGTASADTSVSAANEGEAATAALEAPALEVPVTETPVTAPTVEPAATVELPQPAPARTAARIEPIVETAETSTPPNALVDTAELPASAAQAPSVARPGQYLIQLLSVRSEPDARRAWTQLQSRHGAIIGTAPLDLETADLGARGTYYRVRFGAFDERSAANAACKALKNKGQDCLVKRAE